VKATALEMLIVLFVVAVLFATGLAVFTAGRSSMLAELSARPGCGAPVKP
jgi:hypothetical protein